MNCESVAEIDNSAFWLKALILTQRQKILSLFQYQNFYKYTVFDNLSQVEVLFERAFLIKQLSKAESYTTFENHVDTHQKNLRFPINLVTFLASKLIQHVIAIRSIKNLDTGSYFAINLVNFLASKLIQHVIAIGSIKNLYTAHILQ